MAEYTATWKVVIEADSDEEARGKHRAALRSTDEAPCSIYVWGDGPQVDPAAHALSFDEAAANLRANSAVIAAAMTGAPRTEEDR